MGKNPLKSKTIHGLLVAVAGLITAYFAIDVDEATKATIINEATALIAGVLNLAGLIWALYGRSVAKEPLKAPGKTASVVMAGSTMIIAALLTTGCQSADQTHPTDQRGNEAADSYRVNNQQIFNFGGESRGWTDNGYTVTPEGVFAVLPQIDPATGLPMFDENGAPLTTRIKVAEAGTDPNTLPQRPVYNFYHLSDISFAPNTGGSSTQDATQTQSGADTDTTQDNKVDAQGTLEADLGPLP